MKDKILLILGGVGTLVFIGLVFYSPSSSQSYFTQFGEYKTYSSATQIEYEKETSISSSSRKITLKNISKEVKKKMDPTIRVVTFDRYKTFMLQLIDPGAKESIKNLSYKDYYAVEGKIDNKPFYLKVPKEIVEKDNVVLKIINLKNGEKIEITPSFLKDLPSIDNEGRLIVNLSTKEPNSFDTDIRYPDPELKTALPPI